MAANSDEEKQSSDLENASEDQQDQEPSNADDNGDGDDEADEEDEEEEPPSQQKPLPSRLLDDQAKLDNLFRRLSTEKVQLRVHDVIIKGNAKTKDYLIEAELEAVKKATSVQELIEAAGNANAKLQQLQIFDSVRITLDSGPPELPGTSNVIVEVVENKNPLTGEIGMYTKPAVPIFLYSFIVSVVICFCCFGKIIITIHDEEAS